MKFARKSDALFSDEVVSEWLKIEEKEPHNKGKTGKEIWEDYLNEMNKSDNVKWADEVIIRATAMFFEKDIFMITESTSYFVYGSVEGQTSL